MRDIFVNDIALNRYYILAASLFADFGLDILFLATSYKKMDISLLKL
jgi:hypothetical protein